MDSKIWQALPEDLLFMILGRLPVRFSVKLRSVCKRWNYVLCCRDTLQRMLDANSSNPMRPTSRIPGFFVQIWTPANGCETWAIEGGGSEVYKVRLRERRVVSACNSLIFCRRYVYGRRLIYSIENPATRTSRLVPPCPHRCVLYPRRYNCIFNAMAFDASTRRVTIVVGTNDSRRMGNPYMNMNMIEMEIYDTNSNAWSCISMTVPGHIHPIGRGIYSGGKFYWLVGRTNAWPPSLSKCILAFTLADRLWEEIPLPENATWGAHRFAFEEFACLSGCDGRVVLICEANFHDIYLWTLNENGSHEWCEVRVALSEHQGIARAVKVAVNSNGWIMVMARSLEILIFNGEGKFVWRVKLPRLPQHHYDGYVHSSRYMSVFPFEANNMWWPTSV